LEDLKKIYAFDSGTYGHLGTFKSGHHQYAVKIFKDADDDGMEW
jgi:hypothetical protein